MVHMTHKLPPINPSTVAWSTHSIHVMAANLLHCGNFTSILIHNRLCWRSSSFLVYLQNTSYSAWSYTIALNWISVASLPLHRASKSHPNLMKSYGCGPSNFVKILLSCSFHMAMFHYNLPLLRLIDTHPPVLKYPTHSLTTMARALRLLGQLQILSQRFCHCLL